MSIYTAPEANLESQTLISCSACGNDIHIHAATCPHCGMSRRTTRYKSKITAAVIAFFLGALGIHRFYLGQWWGVFYLLLFWTGVPGLVAFCEFIYFLVKNQQSWDEKYNEGLPAGEGDKSNGALIILLVFVGLIVFFAVIGILAAIAIPAYQQYVERAKEENVLILPSQPALEHVVLLNETNNITASLQHT